MRNLKALGAICAFFVVSGQALPAPYAEGQVWEYRTRPGDEGSLLKIQRIERDPAFEKSGPVYHISVVGFHLQNPTVLPMLPHAPVTKQTLDASVTALSKSDRPFPPAEAGIEEWRQAQGGVFTISVAEIIDILDRQVAAAQ